MSKKSLILVIIQFSAMAFFAIDGFTQVNSWLFAPQLVALFISLWGVVVMRNFNIQPEVKATAQMVRKGPYRIIRNPMYSGIIVFFAIAIILQFSYLRLGIYLALTIVLLMKIAMEETFLAEKFGQTYLDYKAETYRLFPYLF